MGRDFQVVLTGKAPVRTEKNHNRKFSHAHPHLERDKNPLTVKTNAHTDTHRFLNYN